MGPGFPCKVRRCLDRALVYRGLTYNLSVGDIRYTLHTGSSYVLSDNTNISRIIVVYRIRYPRIIKVNIHFI